ncbi:serine palmitoyltransferase [Marinimicrococcus flavescens]|uniref:Aminotransferase class I/II-fold pyridoxal phosphate-dependent enzyme n=1 Tax=Marinimicrococcus flavescens TaxID=3031815 RepID=A0AAP3XQY0_9PROT|nr:aminotransferase class I/II-fold pyridoxal phosphate-dependent enzyme [Marinimicrococcus flavescens]
MDIFDKYAQIAGRHDKVLELGTDPFGVRLDEILSATEARVDGRHTILVGTNNYLGLTFDEGAIEAAVEAVRTQGTGTTGSRIANGTYALHRQLEEEFAQFLGRRSCMVFTTGYQANLGMIVGLAGPRDVIYLDADSHASIYDGCRLSGAKVVRFRHNDPEDLDRRLARQQEGEAALVIVEGLYSMLGDVAPIAEFAEVKKKHGAWLMVDEAHSFGVFGERGRGVAEAQGVEEDVDFVVGTFSKSLGGIGGFGASSHPRFDVLRYCSRPYMFTASPNPASIASVRAALARIDCEPGLRGQIWANARQLHEGLAGLGFDLCSPMSPVIAVKMPDEGTAVWAWNRLLELGVYVNLAVPPGTPNGVCLLRCSVSAAHRSQQIEEVLGRFGQLAQELAAARA